MSGVSSRSSSRRSCRVVVPSAVPRARLSEVDDVVVRGSAPGDDQRDDDEAKADAEKSGAPWRRGSG